MSNNHDELNDVAEKLKKDAKQGAAHLKEGAQVFVNKGRDAWEEAGDQAKHYTAHLNTTLNQAVKQNPILSVGVAALTGAVLALLLCR